jgi:hypothetical protein
LRTCTSLTSVGKNPFEVSFPFIVHVFKGGYRVFHTARLCHGTTLRRVSFGRTTSPFRELLSIFIKQVGTYVNIRQLCVQVAHR